MLEFADHQPPLEVQESEYLRLLGFPREYALAGRARELADWARAWYAKHGRPWIFAKPAEGIALGVESVSVGGVSFVSERLRASFGAAEAHAAMLVAVSAGPECEQHARRCWLEDRPDEYFFLESYGSAVVESLVAQAARRICAWADQSGMGVLPHYSPGYPGWPISDQVKLWRQMRGENGVPFPGEIEVLETGMLRPKKSLLAVFGVTRHPEKLEAGARLVPCENCSLPVCQYRRAPYRYALPRAERISRPPRRADELEEVPSVALTLNARYRTNPRALEKWARGRLELESGADGSVTARFQYDGTTCSNLGQPLSYEYVVRLRPATEAYRVAELHCAPAAGDLGHKQMCEYLKDAAGLRNSMATERPLLGRPLDDVLRWERARNPAGCYCEASSREHKWGLVLEVIHFALAHGTLTERIASARPIAELSIKGYDETV